MKCCEGYNLRGLEHQLGTFYGLQYMAQDCGCEIYRLRRALPSIYTQPKLSKSFSKTSIISALIIEHILFQKKGFKKQEDSPGQLKSIRDPHSHNISPSCAFFFFFCNWFFNQSMDKPHSNSTYKSKDWKYCKAITLSLEANTMICFCEQLVSFCGPWKSHNVLHIGLMKNFLQWSYPEWLMMTTSLSAFADHDQR